MKRATHLLVTAGLLLLASPLAAQHEGHGGQAMKAGLMADLMRDVEQVQTKVLGLAEAIPEGAWSWRPGEGVRSVGEVFLHIAADNYFIPTAAGAMPPAATGIKAGDYASVQAYEGRKLDKAATVAEVKASFEHLSQVMHQVDEAAMDEQIQMFGQSFTRRQMWVLTTTHLHEHLGQMIAYARSNAVVPPWSR